MITLKLSPTIQHEWAARGIGGVIPELDSIPLYQEVIVVTEACCREIMADCAFYMDPKAVDATIGERKAYRALMEQCAAALRA